jgi:hypothetical protein
MLSFWCFTIAGAATLLAGHSLLAGLVAGLAAVAARYLLPRAVAFGNAHRPQRRAQRRSGGEVPAPAGRPVGSMRKWRSIPMVGRTIIVAIAVLVFALAGVACTTSYNAIYRLVSMFGLYGKPINQVFPLMLDVAFIGCELAAILGTILRALHVRRLRFPTGMDPDDIDDAIAEAKRQVSRGWPVWTMLTCGVATIAFNVAHASLLAAPAPAPAPGLTPVGGTALLVWRCVVASFPPLVMILFFQVLIAVVKWTMLTTGRPLHTGAALSPITVGGLTAFPSTTGIQDPQIGQARMGVRAAIEAYLDDLDDNEVAALTDSALVEDMADLGVRTSRTYAGRILSEYRAPQPAIDRRRNGGRRR